MYFNYKWFTLLYQILHRKASTHTLKTFYNYASLKPFQYYRQHACNEKMLKRLTLLTVQEQERFDFCDRMLAVHYQWMDFNPSLLKCSN